VSDSASTDQTDDGASITSETGAAERADLAEQAESDQVDLNEALAGLAGIVTGAASLNALLEQVARFASGAIPGAQGVGVTLMEAGRSNTVVASEDFVRAVDEIQYHLMEGPCVTAAAERRTVRSGSLASDRLWPRFGPRVARLGVHSALSMPLVVDDVVVGAMNVYAKDKDVFDDHAAQLGQLFAGPAAVAVRNAQVLEQARRLTEQLQTALSSRAVIDQALGIVMGRTGGTADEAFASLRRMSQSSNTRVNLLAQGIVDEAVRRARARHARS
jgi:GAF domain-containing protein